MVNYTQTIRLQHLVNGLSMIDHFLGLALKGLNNFDLKEMRKFFKSRPLDFLPDFLKNRKKKLLNVYFIQNECS